MLKDVRYYYKGIDELYGLELSHGLPRVLARKVLAAIQKAMQELKLRTSNFLNGL